MNQASGELEPTDPTGTSTKIRRCAVYARVSSSSRDDTPLSSIEAQIESCKAYVHSQKGMGWELIETVYADDGFSGGTMERPALQQLFQDMEDGKIDAVVIQRLDRICRNVLDICDIIPLFTIPGIALVSVNQSLDTESPQGRLMINMLTSFAHHLNLTCVHVFPRSMPMGRKACMPLPIGCRRGAGPASESPDEGVAFLEAQKPRNFSG